MKVSTDQMKLTIAERVQRSRDMIKQLEEVVAMWVAAPTEPKQSDYWRTMDLLEDFISDNEYQIERLGVELQLENLRG